VEGVDGGSKVSNHAKVVQEVVDENGWLLDEN
jgi:hypothetical protein